MRIFSCKFQLQEIWRKEGDRWKVSYSSTKRAWSLRSIFSVRPWKDTRTWFCRTGSITRVLKYKIFTYCIFNMFFQKWDSFCILAKSYLFTKIVNKAAINLLRGHVSEMLRMKSGKCVKKIQVQEMRDDVMDYCLFEHWRCLFVALRNVNDTRKICTMLKN